MLTRTIRSVVPTDAGERLIATLKPTLEATGSPAPHDRSNYCWRNRVERSFNKLKNWRRFATRYDKTVDFYFSFVSLASALS